MICEYCKSKHDGSYGSGRFCSERCSRTYAQSKIRKTMKVVPCISCGKEIEINSRCSSKKAKCDLCKDSTCNYCGRKSSMCNGSSTNWICKAFRIYPALEKYFGFNPSVVGTTKLFSEFLSIRNQLIEDYHVNEMSLKDMCVKYGHPHETNFCKILNSLRIERRTSRDGIVNAIKHGKFNVPKPSGKYQYKHGWHTTWNGKTVYYRSSYELDFAKMLDSKHVDYDMECLRIPYWDTQKGIERVAIPDFYLPRINEIVEVKSGYTYDLQNMEDKRKAYMESGYGFRLWLNHEFVENGTPPGTCTQHSGL